MRTWIWVGVMGLCGVLWGQVPLVVHGKVFNGDEILEGRIRQMELLVPDTTKVVSGAHVIFQRLNYETGLYEIVAETQTGPDGRYEFMVTVEVREEGGGERGHPGVEVTPYGIVNRRNERVVLGIYDGMGRRVTKVELGAGRFWRMPDLRSGVYFVYDLMGGRLIGKVPVVDGKGIIKAEESYELMSNGVGVGIETMPLDTTQRFVFFPSDTSMGVAVYPFTDSLYANFPNELNINVTLISAAQPIKYLLDTTTNTLYPTDEDTTTTIFLRDLYYTGVGGPEYPGYPVWFDANPGPPIFGHLNPEWFSVQDTSGNLTQPWRIYIGYNSTPSESQWHTDSTQVVKAFGLNPRTEPPQQNEPADWYYMTGFPQIAFLVAGLIDTLNVLYGVMIRDAGGNWTQREADPWNWTPNHPWTGWAIVGVSDIYPHFLYQETKFDGETEVYTYIPSVYYEVGPAGWPSNLDAVNRKIGQILKIATWFGLNSEYVYLPGYLLDESYIKDIIYGNAEPNWDIGGVGR